MPGHDRRDDGQGAGGDENTRIVFKAQRCFYLGRLPKMTSLFRMALVVSLSSIAGCGLCSDDIKLEQSGPDGSLKATWFVRNCGATTDFSTIVSVHRSDNSYKDDGSIVFVAKGRGRLRVRWDDARHLRIECAGCQRNDVFKEITVLGDVNISY
jgi:hypothetical protein